MGGSYLVLDTKMNLYVKAGMGEMGTKRRWKEHVSGNLINPHVNWSSKFIHVIQNVKK